MGRRSVIVPVQNSMLMCQKTILLRSNSSRGLRPRSRMFASAGLMVTKLMNKNSFAK